jgi:large subunit ribosomal protein L17
MRHRKACVKLGRTASHRNAMLRNMATSLFEKERIVTTLSKGKAVKPLIDKLVTLAKKGDLHSIRQVASVLTKKDVVKKVFEMAKERFTTRTSGYTLMVKCGIRKGDVAPMVFLRLANTTDIKPFTGSSKGKQLDRSRRVAASRRSSDTVNADTNEQANKPANNIDPANIDPANIDASEPSSIDLAKDTPTSSE